MLALIEEQHFFPRPIRRIVSLRIGRAFRWLGRGATDFGKLLSLLSQLSAPSRKHFAAHPIAHLQILIAPGSGRQSGAGFIDGDILYHPSLRVLHRQFADVLFDFFAKATAGKEQLSPQSSRIFCPLAAHDLPASHFLFHLLPDIFLVLLHRIHILGLTLHAT